MSLFFDNISDEVNNRKVNSINIINIEESSIIQNEIIHNENNIIINNNTNNNNNIEEREKERDIISKITKMKGRDLMKSFPDLKDLLFKKFEEDDKTKDMINIMNSFNFFDFIEMIKIHLDTLEDQNERKSIINTVSFCIYSDANNMTEEQIKERKDTERIFNFRFETVKLQRLFDFLQSTYNKEVSGELSKNPFHSTFMLIYNMKKTFIFMKKMDYMSEEQYIGFMNEKLGFSLENLEKIKDFIKTPLSSGLNNTDKSDILGFLSTYTNIPKQYSSSKIIQNRLFSDIDNYTKKQQMIQKIQKRREEKKRLEEEEKRRLMDTKTNEEIQHELDNLLKELEKEDKSKNGKSSKSKNNKSSKSKK